MQTLWLCLLATRVIWDIWEQYQQRRPNNLPVSIEKIHGDAFICKWLKISSISYAWTTAENGLSFIETSALDATNVELSFQRNLTGKIYNFNTHLLIWINNMRWNRNLSNCIQQGIGNLQQCNQTNRRTNHPCISISWWKSKIFWRMLLNALIACESKPARDPSFICRDYIYVCLHHTNMFRSARKKKKK